jgi:hypothetical protein
MLSPNNSLQSDGNRRPLLGLVSIASMVPVGASKCVGASRSAARAIPRAAASSVHPTARLRKLLQRGLVIERRRQPSLALRRQRIIGQIRPGLCDASRSALRRTSPIAPFLQRF